MADITYTTTDVQHHAGRKIETAELGEDIDPGMSVYYDQTDDLLKKASASSATTPDSGDHLGVSLAGGTVGQTVPYMRADGDAIDFGAGTFTKGQVYIVSATGGGIKPAGDLTVSVNEVQRISVSGATTGSIKLTFDGQTTVSISFDGTATDVETALEALSNIDDVVTTGGPLNTAAIDIEFKGINAATNVPEMTITNNTDGTVSIETPTQGVTGDFPHFLGRAETDAVLRIRPWRTEVQA